MHDDEDQLKEGKKEGKKYGDTLTRLGIRANAFLLTILQSKQVNNWYSKISKQTLKDGDICKIEVESKIHEQKMPNISRSQQCWSSSYKDGTKDRKLMRRYQCQQLHFMPLLTKDLPALYQTNETEIHE